MHVCHLPISLPRLNHKPSGSYIVDLTELLDEKTSHKIGLLHVHPRRITKIRNFPFLRIMKLYEGGLPNRESINVWVNEKSFLIPIKKRNSKKWRKSVVEEFERYVDNYGRPDLIHAHSGRGSGEAALDIYKGYNIPYIVMEHNPIYLTGKISVKEKKRLQEVYKSALRVCPVSSQMNKTIGQIINDRGKLEVTPNFVSEKFEKVSLEDLKTHRKLQITIVGRLVDNKNVSMGIRAFKLFQENYPNSQLDIIGSGDNRDNLKQLVKELGLNEKINFHGYTSREFIVDLLSKSHVFLLSSINEPFGIPVIESLACGCPVVATRCGGPEEIAKNINDKELEAVKLVDRDNYKEMSKKMKRSISSSRELKKRKEIRERALNNYGTEKIAKMWEEKYNEILRT